MTPFDALAAAIRERLTSGRPAPLPGLGTLVRQHVSARVEERADGTRVLLPPGETIGLTPTDDTHETLAPTFGRLLALPDSEVQRAYAEAADQLEARLAATGEVRLPGVGLLRRTSGGVILGVEAELLAAVNRMYEGLSPVGPSRSDDGAAAASPTGAPPAADAPTENGPGGAYDDEPFADDPTDDEAAGADPFMIGLPPVDTPEPIQDADTPPPPATDEPHPADPDPWESAASEPAHDDPSNLPVTADASEFGFAPPPVATFDFVDAPPSSSGDEPDEGAPYPSESSLPPSPAPDDTDGDDGFDAPTPAVEDEPPPEPFDPGDLSSEPLLASDLVPGTVEPPEPDEPFAYVPDEAAEDAPLPPVADSVQEGTFVDDDTLDADLDDVLAVPFGRPDDGPIAEVLPPSAPVAGSGDDTSDAETATSDDEWVADTWTSGGSPPPPVGLGERDTVEIEDAEVIDDGPQGAGWSDGDLIAEGDTEEALGSVEEEGAPPPPGPEDEFEALLASPPAPPAEPTPPIETDAPPSAAADEPLPRRRPWGWVLALLVLGAAVAAAVWLWPRFSDAEEAPPSGAEVLEPVAVPTPDVEPTPPPDDDRSDSLASPPAVTPGGATPSAVAPGAAAPAGQNVPPEPDAPSSATPSPRGGSTAFAPPRLDGLDAGDRRTLVGPPIDPSMGGWTLIVASLRSEVAANELMGRYRAAGYRTAVFPPSGRTVTRYRIGVGQFGSRDQARRLLDRVHEYEPGGTWPLNLRTL